MIPVRRMFLKTVRTLAIALSLAGILSVSVAAQPAVKDSVRMDLRIYQFHVTGACGVGIVAVWPNVLQDLLGSETRTYGYRDYGKVATEGMYIPAGYGEAVTKPESGLFIPDGYVGHNPQLGGGAFSLSGTGPVDCSGAYSFVTGALSGSWTLLNAQPFRITEWYATFNIPDGTVIALFEWEQGDGLTIDFDASFESEQSRVVDASAPGKKRPVSSYSWNFGDGSSGTGARPSHTYDEAGEYTVRLVVADEDGNEASREETVTVHSAHLTVEILSATEKVSQGDTLTVVGQVTNSGTEPIFGVRAARLFTYVTRLPEGLDVEGGQTFYLDVKPAALTEGDDDYVNRARLDPGESFEVTRDYVVHRAAQYRNVRSSDPSFRLEDIYLDWTGFVPVEGETPEIDKVVVRQPCLEAEEPCATTHVQVFHVDLDVRTFTTEDILPVETSTVRAGLIVGPRPDLPTFNGQPTRIVDHRVQVDGKLRCRTGCIDFEVVATDQDTGEPLEGLRLDLSHPAIGGPRVVTPAQGGGYICDRADATCARKITLTTDAEGRVEAYLAVPGVINTVNVTVTVRTAPVQPAAFLTASGVNPHDLTIEPNVIHNSPLPLSSDDARRLAFGSLVRTSSDLTKIPSLNSLCNDIAGGYNKAAYGLRVFDPVNGVLPSDLLDGLCRKVNEYTSNDVLSLGKQVSIIPQMRWFFNTAQIPSKYLAQSNFQKSYPFFNVTSQFVDELGKAFDSQLGNTWPVTLPAGPVPFSLFEVSYLRRNTLGPEPRLWSSLYFRLWSHTALIDEGYLAPSWVRELNETSGPRILDEQAEDGSTSISMTPSTSSLSKAASLTGSALHPVDGATGTTLLLTDTTQRTDSLFAGAILSLSPDNPERAEMVRILSVSGDPGSGQIAELASPLVFSHPAGDSLYVIGTAQSDVAPTPYLLAPDDSVSSEGVVRLAWATFQPVTEVVVEVALDPDFGDLALTRTVSGPDLMDAFFEVPIGDGGFQVDVPYYWRALSRDRTGESVWSDTTRFVVSSLIVSIEDEDPELELPRFVDLEQNYPNPFNPTTTIVYSVPYQTDVTISVYDLLGRRVALLVNEPRQQGTYTVNWDASGVASGVYIYRMEAAEKSITRKMTLLK